MIRYVLAISLAVTVLGMTATALDQAAAANAERSIEAEIATVEAAATELLEDETPTPSAAGPQRTVEIDIPEASDTVAGTEQFVFEPATAADATRVRYRVGNRAEKQRTLDFLLRHPETEQFDLSNHRGTVHLRLTLKTDETGERYVEITLLEEPDV
ncbi:DUF7311 family protein [Halobacteriaceae archaeon SHR40]|uniref:DUF7311 family protein n=1 Tax=Halovenus amylolytica TaxID=2500550 RepID=UPI000FE29F93